MTYRPKFALKTHAKLTGDEDYIASAELTVYAVEVKPRWALLYEPAEKSFTSYQETHTLTFPTEAEVQATLRLLAQNVRKLMAVEGHIETKESRKKF